MKTGRPLRLWRVAVLAGAALPLGTSAGALAQPTTPIRSVKYRGYVIRVPRSWPVYDLQRNPAVCVRFNRHALYLGRPSGAQRCPAHAAGRTEAILVQPLKRGVTSAPGSASVLALRRRGLLVTAAWANNPDVVAEALGLRSLQTLHAPRLSGGASLQGTARAAQAGGGVYTGLGFDACSAPSASAMSAWASSQYRGVGIYIGGTNMACVQPNLTSSWVSDQVAAGWHPVPIYVGLQAPTNLCGCQPMVPSRAHGEGVSAANAAVSQAEHLGIGPGNPIYFDMEGYARGGTNTSAVLAFLSAWTAQLHADGFISGVYSSASSGISDLVAQFGKGYLEPDAIWFADWNGQQSSSDPYVPSADWPSHQRLHQYQGPHNETHGAVTLNVDSDYLDGATAGTGTTTGYWLFSSTGKVFGSVGTRWFGSPAWRGAKRPAIVGMAATTDGGGYWLAGSSGQVWSFGDAAKLPWARRSQPVAGIAADPAGGYWLFTASGGVYGVGARWFGSPAWRRARGVDIVGMASTTDGRGYWVVASSGQVWSFGDAAKLPWARRRQPVAGIAADPAGGYWLFTASGGVYGVGARWFGSPVSRGAHRPHVVGVAATTDGGGYWVVGSSGQVWSFGDAPRLPRVRHARSIAGISPA